MITVPGGTVQTKIFSTKQKGLGTDSNFLLKARWNLNFSCTDWILQVEAAKLAEIGPCLCVHLCLCLCLCLCLYLCLYVYLCLTACLSVCLFVSMDYFGLYQIYIYIRIYMCIHMNIYLAEQFLIRCL